MSSETRLWDASSGKELNTLPDASSASWSPDAAILACQRGDGTTRLLDARTRKLLRVIKAASLAWSPDGKMLASHDNEAIRLWDPVTGKEVRPREGHESFVTSVCWSPDGNVVASGSYDKTIRLWEPATGKTIRALEGHVSPVYSVCWSPDGRTVASGSEFAAYHGALPDKNPIRLWDPATGREVCQLAGPSQHVKSLAWSPDGKTLASASDDKTIRLWEPASGREVRRLLGRASRVGLVAWSPDGKTLASVGDDGITLTDNKIIRLWEAASGKELRRIAQEESISSVAWSPDSKTLASAGWDKTTRLWETTTGKEIRRIAGQDGLGWSVAWSPDGKTLASSNGNRICLFEAATGKQVRQFAGHDESVWSVAWSPDGKRLASASSDTTLLIWAVRHQPDEPPIRLELSELKSCWIDLAGDDAPKAYHAVATLTRGAKDSIPFLAERLKPVPPPDPKRISRLIEDLDDNRFSVRQKATDELEQLAEFAEPALRRVLGNKPSLEMHRRVEQLLGKVDGWSGERLQALRAITVLENVATADARQILESMAKGTAEARLTQEAKASLGRLAKRTAPAR